MRYNNNIQKVRAARATSKDVTTIVAMLAEIDVMMASAII